jgi:hypothetical protein
MRCLLVKVGVGRASDNEVDRGDSDKSAAANDSVKDGREVECAPSSIFDKKPELELGARYDGGGIEDGR